PLEALPNLTRHLGGPQLYIKRDDLTGLGLGGNKVRKLEFLLGEARSLNANTIITTGATQSNHVRQTAAAAAKLGLKCVILLEERVHEMSTEYTTSGNVLLNRLLGAELLSYPEGTDMTLAMHSVAARLDKGARPYIVPVGGSSALGALGYCVCALEILSQASEMNLRIDRVIVASGSGGTHDGLVTGLSQSGIGVLGISVSRRRDSQEKLVHSLALETSELLGVTVARDQVVVNSDFVGPAYGVPTAEMVEAVKLAASLEGILLDPVYTGKAMAGLIGLIRRGTFSRSENILFVHTGGTPALFAYTNTFT
ncbi:MAG TPA: D-cysteine desulfhydrase, partial [Burkholderiales bacterium]|nr:D-cysteine desulfhydrase [Burkholderiales bacterium]